MTGSILKWHYYNSIVHAMWVGDSGGGGGCGGRWAKELAPFADHHFFHRSPYA